MKTEVNFIYDHRDKSINVHWFYGYKLLVEGKKKYVPLKLSTGITGIELNRWDPEGQRIKTGNDKNKLNAKINNLQGDILIAYNKFINAGITPSPDQIKSALLTIQNPENKASQSIDSLTSIGNYIEDYLNKNEIKPNTRKGYVTTLNKIIDYEKNSQSKMYFETLTTDIVLFFLASAQKIYDSKGKFKKNMAVNTVFRFKRDLRKFINLAKLDGIKCDSKINFSKKSKLHIKEEEADNVYLPVEKIKQLIEFDLNKAGRTGLQLTKDLCIISCMTGLRFSDWERLGKIKSVKLPSGEKINVLNVRSRKVDNKNLQLPVFDIMLEIYQRYGNKFPEPNTNQKYNESIKELGKLLAKEDDTWSDEFIKRTTRGVEKDYQKKAFYDMLSSHTGRRSFCTNSYRAGLSISLIMDLSGHDTEANFLKYIVSSDLENLELYFKTMSKVYAF